MLVNQSFSIFSSRIHILKKIFFLLDKTVNSSTLLYRLFHTGNCRCSPACESAESRIEKNISKPEFSVA